MIIILIIIIYNLIPLYTVENKKLTNGNIFMSSFVVIPYLKFVKSLTNFYFSLP